MNKNILLLSIIVFSALSGCTVQWLDAETYGDWVESDWAIQLQTGLVTLPFFVMGAVIYWIIKKTKDKQDNK